MGVREIRTGVGTYRRASDGEWGFGMFGEEVDVHEDDLERFDRLNPEAPVEIELDEVDEIVSDDPNGEPIEIVGEKLPDAEDASWTHARIDEYAVGSGISYDGIVAEDAAKPTRAEKVAHILSKIPAAVAVPAGSDTPA